MEVAVSTSSTRMRVNIKNLPKSEAIPTAEYIQIEYNMGNIISNGTSTIDFEI